MPNAASRLLPRILKALFAMQFLVAVTCCAVAELSHEEKSILDAARERYYNPDKLGLVSFRCGVEFDLSTVPITLLPAEDVADRTLLKGSEIIVKYERRGPTVSHSYPPGTSSISETNLTPLMNWMTSIVQGFFLTWPSKALQGPIPPFDSQIESVAHTQEGYSIVLRVPGGPVQVFTDNQYLVTKIVSVGGNVVETPTYSVTPDGLLYSGTHVINHDPQGGTSDIRLEIESSTSDGFRLPSSVRLRVDNTVDVRFALTKCSVEKGMVLQVSPPNHVQ